LDESLKAGCDQYGIMKSDDQKDRILSHEERKVFDFIDKDPVLEIEGTAEYPVMYRALGSEPRTQHPFHLYEDIRSEPVAVQKTLEIIQPSIQQIAADLIKRDITHILGLALPTSQFVAQAANPAFWQWAGISAEDRDSVEVLCYDKPYDPKHTAVFAYSGSGSTFDTLEATKKMKAQGMYTVAVTSVAGSPLTKIADSSIVCAGGFDTGGSDTFHYATRLSACLALAAELGTQTKNTKEDVTQLKKDLYGVPKKMAERLDSIDARCHSIAKYTKDMRSAIIVGAGPNFGTAEEMELKFEEMAHIPAKSMVPTRHLHGALGLTTEKIMTILLNPTTKAQQWMDQIADTTVGLKSPSMAIVPDEERDLSLKMDWVIRCPYSNEFLYALFVVPAIQMYPYYCAVEQGNINPDCQRSNIPKHARVWKMVLKRGGH
jgi:glucosamine--fructose-6-phosphate aminotransferase (isomerizing)